jgi:O-antigen ligase
VAILAFAQAANMHASAIMRTWPLYLWPALAVISGAWSLVPGLSVYHGVQLAATLLVGSVFFMRCGFEKALRIIFGALAIAILLSLISRGRDQFGNLQGIFGHKNQLGSAAVMLFYTAAVLFWSGWKRFLTGGVALLAVGAAVLSKSGTALLTLGIVIAVLGICAVWVFSRAAFALFLALGITVAACSALIISLWDIDLISLIFGLVGKDKTLTGRTVLWEYGWLTFVNNPWLGIGYKSYMASAETSGGLVQYILQQRLPYLHNNWLEVAVAFGVPGFIVFGSVLALICKKSIGAFVRRREVILAWPLCFLFQKLMMSITENPFFYNHSLDQTLLMVVYLSALPAAALAQGYASDNIPAKDRAF